MDPSSSTTTQKNESTVPSTSQRSSTSTTSASSSSATSSSSYPHWHDIVAGAAAGFGARAVTAPLDLLKIRRQLQPTTSVVSSGLSVPAMTKAGKVTAGGASSSPLAGGGEWNVVRQLRSIAEKEGGLRSLYRGNVAASYLWMGYSVTQFWLYGHASERLRARYGSEEIPQTSVAAVGFASGAFAGLCATIVTYPFDLCRTVFAARGLFPIAASNVTWSEYTTDLASNRRMQQRYVQHKPPKTLRDFAVQMHRHGGWRGFYAGSAPGLLQIVPYMGMNFAMHDALIATTSGRREHDDRGLASGLAGMGAGVVSKFLVYPLDTVKKRLQAQAFWSTGDDEGGARRSAKYTAALPKNQSMYSNRQRVVEAVNNRGVAKRSGTGGAVLYEGMIDCFKQILRKEGAAAFYKGLLPSLLKSSISTGASFWLFTLTKNILRSVHDSNHV